MTLSTSDIAALCAALVAVLTAWRTRPAIIQSNSKLELIHTATNANFAAQRAKIESLETTVAALHAEISALKAKP